MAGFHDKQHGAALLVALIMLVVLTLFVVSAINSSNTNLRIAGNMQIQEEAAAAAQQAIEEVVSSLTNLTSTTTQTFTESIGGTNYAVTIEKECLGTVASPGYSAAFAASAPQDMYWELKATVTDSRTGTKAVVHQGIKVKLDSSTACP